MKFIFLKLLKSKKELISSLVLIIFIGLVLVFALWSANRTVAWFASHDKVSATGMQVVMQGDTYDILIKRDANEYERTPFGNNVYPGVSRIKAALTEKGLSSVPEDISVNEAGSLAYELVNEFEFDHEYYLRPDSYGHLTFYIRPVSSGDHLTIDFGVDIGAYVEGTTSMSPVTNALVNNLLQGHILVFEDRTGSTRENFIYSGLITDVFSFDSDDYTLIDDGDYAGCYEVTLYWEWPLSYWEILENINDGTTGRFPAELTDYIAAHKNYFFAINQNSTEIEELSDGYDDGDQNIGNKCDYLVVFLTTL